MPKIVFIRAFWITTIILVLSITFNFPVRYVRHYPLGYGKEVRIQFNPLQTSLDDREGLRERESLFPPAKNPAGVVRVEFEGSDFIEPTITVVFDRPRSFEAKQGLDFRSLIILVPLDQSYRGTRPEKGAYVISLTASLKSLKKKDFPSPELTRDYRVYTTGYKKDGKLWHRLRVGFFRTASEARRVAEKRFKKQFPDLWIDKASEQDIAEYLLMQATAAPFEKAPAVKKAPTVEKAPAVKKAKPEKEVVKPTAIRALSPERQETLIKQGEEFMTQKNFGRAVQIYTKLLESSDPEVKENAQFRLALAQENGNHLAHARAEYKNYLREYPDGPNAEEAHDRLKALLSATVSRKPGVQKSLWQNDFYGSISQFYDLDKSWSEGEETRTNISSLTTGLDATWRVRSDNYQLKTVAIGSYEVDLLDSDENEFRASALYMDFENSSRTFSTRLGRQSGTSGGVLGRYDGGRFSYLFADKFRVNLVGGFPVNRSSDKLETDKYFYGINFDLGRFAEHWDFNVFFINQIADNIADRRAVGGEIRYVGSHGSLFALVDYDILFNKLNTVLFAGNWLLPNNSTRVNLTADFRNSPMLSSSNALLGQPITSLSELEDSIGERALRELAEDRTLDSSLVTLGISHPLSEHIQIAGDVTWSRLGAAPASGGVEAIESTGDDFFYSAQLIGSSLLKEGDISTLGVRFAKTKPRNTYTFNLNSRYPITPAWRINPRMQVDYRINNEMPGEQWRLRKDF